MNEGPVFKRPFSRGRILIQDTATISVIGGAAGVKSLTYSCWKVLVAVGGMRHRHGVQHMMANEHQKCVVGRLIEGGNGRQRKPQRSPLRPKSSHVIRHAQYSMSGGWEQHWGSSACHGTIVVGEMRSREGGVGWSSGVSRRDF